MWMTLRRALGGALVLLTVVPLFRLLAGRATGPWGEATIRQAETSLAVVGWGIGISVLLGVLVAALAGGAPGGRGWWRRGSEALGARLTSVPSAGFAWLCAGVALVLSALVAGPLLRGLLTNIDEMAMLVHARYLSAGWAGGPVADQAAHWLIPNTLWLDGRWISQYPPGHLLLLAGGVRLGASGWVGVGLAALIAFSAAASFSRLIPERPVMVRIMGLAVALSPMLAIFGGGIMSHLSALAFVSVSVWAALRARDGAAGWAVIAGAAVGWAVCSRPWSGLLLAGLPLLVWWEARGSLGLRGVVRRVALWSAAGVPFAVGLAIYNRRMFGAATRLGYEVAYGEGHRLGFHVDPWGYPYGWMEALGYTSADVIAFGLQLMESPIPLTLLAALYVLLSPRLSAGARVLTAWAVLPVVGASLYWFHQPRMLFESLPGWIGLGVLGAEWLVLNTSGRLRAATLGTLVASVATGLLVFAPQRIARYGWSQETLERIVAPTPPAGPSLVFVHASWNERLAARLEAAGMRADSLNPVLRRNDACDVEMNVRRRVRGAETSAPPLDRTVTSRTPPHLRRAETGPGLSALRDPARAWSEVCVREARSDRFGAVALAPLLWQGDLPGLETADGLLFARDLGPENNRALLERYPERAAYLFGNMEGDAPPRLVPYGEGMALIWGEGRTP